MRRRNKFTQVQAQALGTLIDASLSKIYLVVSLFFFFIEIVCVCCVLSCFSCLPLCVTLWTVACQSPLFTGFSRLEYWSSCHFPLQGIFPTWGLIPHLLCLLHRQAGFFLNFFFTTTATWETQALFNTFTNGGQGSQYGFFFVVIRDSNSLPSQRRCSVND